LLSWGLLSLLDARLAFPLVVSGMAGLVLFKAAKLLLRRPRPFERHAHVVAHAHPPDVFSFPSGHALHAGALGAIVALAHPTLWLLGVAWALAMSVSRVVLGLHYPSDVAAGVVLGALLGAGAWCVQVLWWAGV
jgi:undecaprenyl-diphosphatase